jgi:DNA-binding winged helix-turn-helix (wHTH) protein
MAGRESYQFGEFLLDVGERRVSRSGQPIQLAPKTYDVLVALLRRAGGLVTKQELLAQVWPEACVEEGILAVHVSALRRALDGQDSTPYIETVSRSSPVRL